MEINIENNRITEKGVIAICKALCQWRMLVRPVPGSRFCVAATNTTLRTLKLYQNAKTLGANQAVGEMLKLDNPQRNTSVTKVTMEWTIRQYKDM